MMFFSKQFLYLFFLSNEHQANYAYFPVTKVFGDLFLT